jgi:hypothetical protein
MLWNPQIVYRNRVRNRLSVVPVRRYLPVDDCGHDCGYDSHQTEIGTPLGATTKFTRHRLPFPPFSPQDRLDS